LAYTSNILLAWKHWNWGWLCHGVPHSYAPGGNRILIAGYRPAQKFVIQRSSCAHRFGNSD